MGTLQRQKFDPLKEASKEGKVEFDPDAFCGCEGSMLDPRREEAHEFGQACARGAFKLPQAVVLELVLLGAVYHTKTLGHAAPEAVDVGVVHEGASPAGGIWRQQIYRYFGHGLTTNPTRTGNDSFLRGQTHATRLDLVFSV